MPEEIRLWQVGAEGLREYPRVQLDLEDRLEGWLAEDITVLRSDLLVIGRQVTTAYNGILDLLCIDPRGDLQIVELKRHRTPREVTAQSLDYASWVSELSGERVMEIAKGYLGTSLDEAFQQKFGISLPESLNQSHGLVIVAAEIDESSERIVRYLSTTYGVDINVATFQFFEAPDGGQYLARRFVLEPQAVEYKSRTRGTSKRLPNLTFEELEETAQERGVIGLYHDLVTGLSECFQRHTTRSSIGFTWRIDGSQKTVLSLIPRESSGERGLRFQLYLTRLASVLDSPTSATEALLPEQREEWKYYEAAAADYSGYAGYFETTEEVERFLEGVRSRIKS